MNRKNYKTCIASCLSAILFLTVSSCTEIWENHYGADNEVVPSMNLWESIQSTAECSQFAKAVEATGYDKTLSASQMYTVWVPKDGTYDVSGLSDKALALEFVENHICRSLQSVPDNADTLYNKNIKVLNGKIIHFNYTIENGLRFGENAILKKNTIAKNGVIHIIDGKASYFDNIWEYLDKDTAFTSLSEFFHSKDTLVFDPTSSVEGGVENGEVFYVDSVINNLNPIFSHLAPLMNEQKDYRYIAPTNQAWQKAYDKISPYFYFGEGETALNLQKDYAKMALVANTVFDMDRQESPLDSLTSTGMVTFYHPDSLLMDAQPMRMSNGYIYKTDSLRIKPTESWHTGILVEGESTSGREVEYCSAENRVATTTDYTISNGKYVEITPTSTTTNSIVHYMVPNTLSASYDIYCVFLPPTVVNPNMKNVLPTKVRFQLIYINANGNSTSINLKSITTDPTKVDTVCIRTNFKFPRANYDQTTNVQFNIIGNVSNKETAVYTKDILLDYIYFKPVE